MGTMNHREEIAASVAAQQPLGPGYDQALAEGLVERIGEEIDNRIAARLDHHLLPDADDRAVAPHDQHGACRHVRRAQRRTERRLAREGRPSVVLAIGSLASAVLATLIVLLAGNNQASGPNGMYRTG